MLRRYGQIALAMFAIFLSGQAIGWMLASQACHARQQSELPPGDAHAWADQMLLRLQEDLELAPGQIAPVKQRLQSHSRRIERERHRALFHIHLQLLELHDELREGLSEEQQKRLAASRQNLLQSLQEKFSDLLSDPQLQPEFKPGTQPPPQ